jgi:glutamyl-tRNA reductase
VAVVVIGIEHTKAPFDVLERVTVPDSDVGKVLTTLHAHENFQEVALLSTCLRTEVYAVVDRFHDAVEDVVTLLAERSGLSAVELEEHQSVYFDRSAAAHLFNVAAGLESAVPGETEVLGQVRRSMERALDEGTCGQTLTGLFQAAVSAGRRARSETAIARGTTSFSHAAVELADARLAGDLAGSKVVVLGAGELGVGTLSALIDPRRAHRPGEVVVVNRTDTKAADAVNAIETDLAVRSAGLDQLRTELQDARLLVTAVEADAPIVDQSHLGASQGAPLLIFDLGMPRNVAHDVDTIAGVEVLDIAALHSVIDRARDERRNEMAAAQAVVVEEVDRYLDAQRGRGAAPIVVALRERLDDLRSAELERRSSELSSLSDDQRAMLEALTRSLVAKIAHEPTIALKESAGTARGERLIEATRQLFDL